MQKKKTKSQICLEVTPSGDKETSDVCKDFGKNGEFVLATDINWESISRMYFLCLFHTSYLSQSSHVRHVEKNLSCGEISDLYTWRMGRNLKNVAEFQISPHERCGEL